MVMATASIHSSKDLSGLCLFFMLSLQALSNSMSTAAHLHQYYLKTEGKKEQRMKMYMSGHLPIVRIEACGWTLCAEHGSLTE